MILLDSFVTFFMLALASSADLSPQKCTGSIDDSSKIMSANIPIAKKPRPSDFYPTSSNENRVFAPPLSPYFKSEMFLFLHISSNNLGSNNALPPDSSVDSNCLKDDDDESLRESDDFDPDTNEFFKMD